MKISLALVSLVVACNARSPASEQVRPAAGSPATPPATAPVLAAAVPVVAKLQPPARPGRIRVAFMLSRDAQVIDFAGPWGVFEYTAVSGYDGSPFELYTVAESADPIRVSGGMMIVPTHTFADAPAPNVVVVPAQGGDPTPAELAWIRRMSKQTDLTMSVCNGAFVLAEAGLLAGKPATAHHEAYTSLANTFPDVRVQRGARFVDADGVSTAGGLTSGIDLALHVVERYYGRDVAEKTTEMLEYQGQGWKDPNSNIAFASRSKPASTPDHPLCPICGMDVDASSPHETYHGKTYSFCSARHQDVFDKARERFAGASP